MSEVLRPRPHPAAMIAAAALFSAFAPVGVLARGMAPVSPIAAAAPSATTPPAAATPPSAPQAPKNLQLLPPADDTGILGKKIMGPDGKELGLVVDVIVDVHGEPRAAVIDFGGFLGVGSRKIAVDWRLLKFVPGQPDWRVLLSLGRAEIQAAPEYKPDAAANEMLGHEMVGPPQEAPPTADTGK